MKAEISQLSERFNYLKSKLDLSQNDEKLIDFVYNLQEIVFKNEDYKKKKNILDIVELSFDINSSPIIVIAIILYCFVKELKGDSPWLKNQVDNDIYNLIQRIISLDQILEKTNYCENVCVEKILARISYDIRPLIVLLVIHRFKIKTINDYQFEEQLKLLNLNNVFFLPISKRFKICTITKEFDEVYILKSSSPLYKNNGDILEYFNAFQMQIEKGLKELGIEFYFETRIKSDWLLTNEIFTKGLDIEENYDKYLFKIVFIGKSQLYNDKALCWLIYSKITAHFKPHPERIRDWTINQNQNGYKGLLFTVMATGGIWIEIEVQSVRMMDLYKNHKHSVYNTEFTIWFDDEINNRVLKNIGLTNSLKYLDKYRKAEIIDNIDEYLKIIFKLNTLKNKFQDYNFLFRGQDIDQPLRPKIGRKEVDNILEKESILINEFKKLVLPDIHNNDIRTDFDWLSIAQHYSLPTRLLDWSENPLIALWFALIKPENKTNDEYRVVWCFITNDLHVKQYESPFNITRTFCYKPNHLTKRITAQYGWFTIHEYSNHGFIPLECNEDYSKRLIKYKISTKNRSEILRKLDVLGVNYHTVFPDIEGLSNYLEWKFL